MGLKNLHVEVIQAGGAFLRNSLQIKSMPQALLFLSHEISTEISFSLKYSFSGLFDSFRSSGSMIICASLAGADTSFWHNFLECSINVSMQILERTFFYMYYLARGRVAHQIRKST